MLWIILGMAGMLSGIVVLVLGSMWGLALLLGGMIVMIFAYGIMMRGRGMNPDQGLFNGLYGQGKQQSEEVEMPQPVIGEQPANIWDKMKQEKK